MCNVYFTLISSHQLTQSVLVGLIAAFLVCRLLMATSTRLRSLHYMCYILNLLYALYCIRIAYNILRARNISHLVCVLYI